ncbi:hypothetical protein HANVADRAFT_4208, partial [Hanseniaspora valbyensis NRRL Y-1626]
LIANNIIRDFKVNIIPQKPKSRVVFIGCNCQLRLKYLKTSSSNTYKLDESFDNCFVCDCMEGKWFKRIKTTFDIQYYLEKKNTDQETENSTPDVHYIDFLSNEKKASEFNKIKPITPIHDPNYCEWCLDLRLMEKSINEMLNNKISCSLSPLVEEKL